MTTQNQPTNPFSPHGPQALNNSMSPKNIQMPAVHPDHARQVLKSKVIASAVQLPSAKALSGTVQGVPSLVELFQALKNDPQLIYEFVHNNIEHKIGMGLAKGDLATLLDSRGNSFDLCSLLAGLLRLAGSRLIIKLVKSSLHLLKLQPGLVLPTRTSLLSSPCLQMPGCR